MLSFNAAPCEAIVRLGHVPSFDSMSHLLTSKDRYQIWAARRMLGTHAKIEVAGNNSSIRQSSDLPAGCDGYLDCRSGSWSRTCDSGSHALLDEWLY